MINQIKKVILTKTFKDTSVTTAGVFINGLLGMAFYIYSARFLGASDFGIFMVSVAFLTLLADVFDLGTTTGLVKFVGKYISSNHTKALQFLKLTFKFKLIIIGTLFVIGWLTTPFICTVLLNRPELTGYFRLSLIGVGGSMLFSFSAYTLQAVQKFYAWSILIISTNLIRLVVLMLLVISGYLNITYGLLNYALVPVLGFLVGLIFIPKFFRVNNENEVTGELLHFNKWVAAFTIVAAVSSRLDTFISARLISFSDLGIYSVAISLSSVIPQVVFAVGSAVAPKFASFETDKKTLNYIKKLQLFVTVITVVGVMVGIPLGYLLVPTLYGEIYTPAIYPLLVLIIAQAMFLLSVPIHTCILYYFAYPKIFLYLSVVSISVTIILGYILISNFGYMGAAYTVLTVNSLNLLISGLWVANKFRKN